MDVYPKYIVQNHKLIISKCTYHKELADQTQPVQGGGFFRFDSKSNTFTFHGSSGDFGQAHVADVQHAIDLDQVYTSRLCKSSVATKYKFIYEPDVQDGGGQIPLN